MSRSGSRSKKKTGGAGLSLEVLRPKFAICRLEPDEKIPSWCLDGDFTSITRTPDELSVVCEQRDVPRGVECERGWRAIQVAGPLDFALVGIMAALTVPLARARIGLFTVSTFDTDYLLVRAKNLGKACDALRAAGHTFADDEERQRRTKAEPEREKAQRERPVRDRPEREQPRREHEPAAESERPRRPRTAEERAEAQVSALRSSRTTEAEEPFSSLEKLEESTRPAPSSRERRSRDRSSRDRSGPSPRPTREILLGDALAASLGETEPQDEPGVDAPSIDEPGVDAPSVDERPVSESKPREVKREAAPEPAASAPRRVVDDEVDSEGLFTGAIAQHPVETTDVPFDDLGLSPEILETINELGFKHPTPIQAQVIPTALQGRDVIGLAETGSGKTAAFVLPLAERLTHGSGIRGLILCPTREIALQTQAFLELFGRNHELDTLPVIGGVRMGPQIAGLRKEPDIIVATPGRLADHMRRGNVQLAHIEALVLDEADHMLDLGFLPQLKEILQDIPTSRQTMMFSATMPNAIRTLANVFMRDPERVDIRPDGQTAAGIEHRLYLVEDDNTKKACLFQLLREVDDGQTLVFVRRKLHVEWLARQIELQGFGVDRIHSDRSQGQRVNALRGFREGQHRILVATDVAARGLDIPGIRHVVNFGTPETVEDYVHRSGRTARGAAIGIVSTIASWQDKEMIREIELAIGKELPRCEAEGVNAYVEMAPRRKTVRRRRLL